MISCIILNINWILCKSFAFIFQKTNGFNKDYDESKYFTLSHTS